MEREHDSLLATPQGLLTPSKRSLLVILATLLVVGVALIFNQYSGLDSSSMRTSPHGHSKNCASPHFKSQTLKLMRERPFVDMFGVDNISKFESSDIIGHASGDGLYCVIDNSYSIARIGHTLADLFSGDVHLKDDALLSWSEGRSNDESGFEYIAYNSSSEMYIVGTESEEMNDGSFRSRSFDVTFEEGRTVVHKTCVCNFRFSHRNKGFEGASVVKRNGKSLLLGLCEGNFCKGGYKGRISGNGRLVVMEREEGEKCTFKTVGVINLPNLVDFQDYSAISVWNGSTIGIASQENAAVFVGEMNPDSLEIGKGTIYDLPRNDNCEIKYCNLEGLYFLRRDVLVTVTDSMKNKAKQHYRCREKDESLQVFQIPPM